MKIFNGVNPVKAMKIVRMKKKGHRSFDYIAKQVGLKVTTVEKVLTNNAFGVIKTLAHEKFVGRRSYATIANKYGLTETSLKNVLSEYKTVFMY
jgi:hypothetical protein